METFMRLLTIATLSYALLLLVLAGASQADPDPRRDLSGLLTGDAKTDHVLETAYMRGYQRGKTDESKSKTR
jgi:hypothetical protein